MSLTEKADANFGRRAGTDLSPGEYEAICAAAISVNFEDGSRSEQIAALHANAELNVGTTSALLNNFKCLVNGIAFKTPMQSTGLQIFVDAIVAKLGSGAVPNILIAIDGYLRYREENTGRRSTEIQSVADDLRQGSSMDALAKQLASHADTKNRPIISEILKEIWVRGAQHAAFRRELVRRWGNKCSVHGTHCNGHLRASHIVAWSLDESLRGDVNNGLLLSVPLDSLFDRGLISFNDSGEIIRAKGLDADTEKHFGIRPGLYISWGHLNEKDRASMRMNLDRHRRIFNI